ncbi:ROK family protein [Haloplanus sp. GCM10025708]|uniref:ROK family protein n=1 Tax=Haloferacaceae TaxID=1644056 RepID=UPI003605D9E6
MAYYVGVDLGATNVRAVVGDDDGVVLGRAHDATPQGPTGIAVTEAVLRVVREACADAGVDPEAVVAAGVGSIGPLDLAAGAVERPANLPDTIDRVPLTGPLSKLLGTERVTLHNDTAAGVVGERFFAERTPDDMVYLTISSGIGAGVAVDGHVLSGWDGNAGEVGHMVVDPEGELTCGCGREGHWEGYCSGTNVPRYARHLHDAEWETDLPIDAPGLSAADVFEAAGDDAFADHVVERLGHWNAVGVANVVHAYAPLVVYVGGAVALNNPDLVLDPIRERLPDLVITNVPEVELTTLGDDAVVKGALASAVIRGTGDRNRRGRS